MEERLLHITGFRVICLTGCYFQVYEYELAAFAVSSFFLCPCICYIEINNWVNIDSEQEVPYGRIF